MTLMFSKAFLEPQAFVVRSKGVAKNQCYDWKNDDEGHGWI